MGAGRISKNPRIVVGLPRSLRHSGLAGVLLQSRDDMSTQRRKRATTWASSIPDAIVSARHANWFAYDITSLIPVDFLRRALAIRVPCDEELRMAGGNLEAHLRAGQRRLGEGLGLGLHADLLELRVTWLHTQEICRRMRHHAVPALGYLAWCRILQGF